MSDLRKIEYLRNYICGITEEIKQIDLKRIQLSSNGYYDMLLQRRSLCNLLALAKNELNTELNQYNFIAFGFVSTKKGEVREKVFKGKVFSEFNFPVKNSRNSNFSDDFLKPLIELITKECAHKFLDSKFEIKSLRRARKIKGNLAVI